MKLRYLLPIIALAAWFVLLPLGVMSNLISFPVNIFIIKVILGELKDYPFSWVAIGIVIQYFIIGYLLEKLFTLQKKK